MQTTDILSIPFHQLTEDEALRTLLRYMQDGGGHTVVTPNPEAVMQARRSPVFRDALLDADLRLADGVGILIASRILGGTQIPCRVRGVDLSYTLLEAAGKMGRSVYFLGGAPGVAEEAAQNMRQRFPGLRVAGCRDGYFNEADEILIQNEIQSCKPDILLLGMGMPRQELWAQRHKHLAPVTLCVGGTLDIMSGRVTLTPAWLRKLGLEWLHRLLREPRRFWRMLDLPRFMVAVFVEKCSRAVPSNRSLRG